MRVENLNINSVLICTPAKVASASFLESIRHLFPESIYHRHSLKELKHTIENKENTLIISGIRNPLDRNISYFFQHYCLEIQNDFRTLANNYEGELCYVMTREELLETSTLKLIDLYFEHQNHYSFNEWFYEFFEITNIFDTEFDKDNGIKIYSLPNNNYLMLYVYEKLPVYQNFVKSFFNIEEFKHMNNSSALLHKHKYKSFKNAIVLNEEYKTKLLKTSIMKYFYTDEQIKKFFEKY